MVTKEVDSKTLYHTVENVGALRVLNTITAKFSNSMGHIFITNKEWGEFCKPYLKKEA